MPTQAGRQLTQEAYDRLKTKFVELETDLLPGAADAIAAAREGDGGNLSENTGYQQALQNQDTLKSQRDQLKLQLQRAQIIKADGRIKTVTVGSFVTLDLAGEEWVVMVGNSLFEDGGDVDVVSPESALGKEVLGKRKGDPLTWKTPAGELSATISKISSK